MRKIIRTMLVVGLILVGGASIGACTPQELCQLAVQTTNVPAPAPGYSGYSCEAGGYHPLGNPEDGWFGWVDYTNKGAIHLTPGSWATLEMLRWVMFHEVGHTWCDYLYSDRSEACADNWAYAHGGVHY